MICYTILKLLFEYEIARNNKNKGVLTNVEDSLLKALSCRDTYFIPVVNLDGFHTITEHWI